MLVFLFDFIALKYYNEEVALFIVPRSSKQHRNEWVSLASKRRKVSKKFVYENGIITDREGKRFDVQKRGDRGAFYDKYTLELHKVIAHHQRIHHNQAVLFDRLLKVNYPHLNRIIGRITKYLYDFNDFCSDKYFMIGFSNFFVSSRYLPKVYGYSNYNTWNRNINIFCALGLVEKIAAPKLHNRTVRRRAIRERKKTAQGLKLRKYRDTIKEVNFYVIPLYDDTILRTADDIAKTMIENNFRTNGFSKIFLIKTFGQEFANKVFPDDRSVTLYSDYVANEIEKFILEGIQRQGYTTKDSILNNLMIDFSLVTTWEYGFHKGSKKAILDREFNRSIGQITRKHGLSYRKANQELKDRLGLDSYKTIIYREPN